jgi:hypothetical protein
MTAITQATPYPSAELGCEGASFAPTDPNSCSEMRRQIKRMTSVVEPQRYRMRVFPVNKNFPS